MNQMAAHIDLLPSLSQLCGAPMPQDRKIDGRSFIPALEEALPERSFFSYWTRKKVSRKIQQHSLTARPI